MDLSQPEFQAAVETATIVILDFGSQYTQLIARRIRELDVFSVVLPCTTPLTDVLALKPKGIILSGGPSSVYDATAPKADPAVLGTGLPLLGICYGLQFMTHHLGGRVVPAAAREYGHAEVHATAECKPLPRPPREPRRLDESWRPRRNPRARLPRSRQDQQRRSRHRQRASKDVGRAVPPRSRPHPPGYSTPP